MKKVARFISILLCFALSVSCCFVKVPPINSLQIQNNIPIDPGAVLFVAGMEIQEGSPMSGSAIVIDSNYSESWAISAGHVCYPELDSHGINLDNWTMIAVDINGDVRPMQIVALDMLNDVCVFKIPIGPMAFVPLAEKQSSIGERAFLGAYPGGMYEPGFVPLFEGFYSGEMTANENKWSSFTIPVAPGSSGGGIVNTKGEIVGIVSMAIAEFENITLAVKLENILALVDVAKKNPN